MSTRLHCAECGAVVSVLTISGRCYSCANPELDEGAYSEEMERSLRALGLVEYHCEVCGRQMDHAGWCSRCIDDLRAELDAGDRFR